MHTMIDKIRHGKQLSEEEIRFQESLPRVYNAFPELFADLLEDGETLENTKKPTAEQIMQRINQMELEQRL